MNDKTLCAMKMPCSRHSRDLSAACRYRAYMYIHAAIFGHQNKFNSSSSLNTSVPKYYQTTISPLPNSP